MKTSRFALLAAVACTAPAASAQFLLVVQSSTDKVLLLSDVDGSVINPAYIDLTVASASTPIEAVIVNNEIWVSDQLADKLMRFSLDGTTYLGSIAGGMDNIRGFAFANGEIYVANFGSGNGAPGQSIVRLSTTGAPLGSFPVADPFDVVEFQGGLLVADASGDDLVRFDFAGNNLGNFHTSPAGGINWPEQLTPRANGNLLATNFSAPIGIYEYDSSGVQLNFWPAGNGNRGVMDLGNGLYMWTDAQGIHTLDPMTGATANVMTGINARFVTRFTGAASAFTSYCPGDGTGTACPCGNNSVPGLDEGCQSSLGSGGKLTAAGNASLASDTVVLHGTQMPSSSALYFQGTAQLAGGAGVQFGDGLRCASGTIVRLKTVTNLGGLSQYPQAGDPSISTKGMIGAPGARTYQVWYRNAAAFCTPATFNLTNAIQVTWGP